MKRNIVFSLFAALLSALLLVSCGPTSPEIGAQTGDGQTETTTEPEVYTDLPIDQYVMMAQPISYYKNGLYLFSGYVSTMISEENTAKMIRYSLDTGNTVYVCPDPLCMHNTEDCPFTGRIDLFFIRENVIYYDRKYMVYKNGSMHMYWQYCTYDLENMKFSMLAEKEPQSSSGSTNKQLLTEKYWYYYDMAYDEETQTGKWVIERLNLKNGKIEQIGNKDGKKLEVNSDSIFAEQFLFILNDRIYFTDTQSIYSTTLDLEDKKVHIHGDFLSKDIYTDGTYIYYAVPEWDTEYPANEYVQHLYRMDLDGRNVLDLEIKTLTGLWMLTDHYIYYQTPKKVHIPSADSQQPEELFRTDAFYRCAHDGSDKEQFFSLQTYKDGSDTPCQAYKLSFFTVANDHVYGIYEVWEDKNEDGKFDFGTEFDSQYAFNTIGNQGVKVLDIDVVNGTHSFIEIE